MQDDQPRKALPLLEQLGRRPEPKYAWLASLVKTRVEVNRTPDAEKTLVARLNRFPGKTAAWDLAVWADLQKSDDAGAAAAMEAPRRLDSADDGRMRELSRMCWKTVGDIACQLRRYEESYEAYQHAAALSDASEIRLKAGYVLMKWDRPDKAGGYFREALDRFPQDSSIVREAHRYLAYIDHLQKIKNSEQPEKP